MNLVYTDDDGVELGYLESYALDLAYGADENDFELTLPYGASLPRKAFVYADGTPWGGVVRGGGSSTMGGVRVSTSSGTTWQGLLAESYVCPDVGKAHFEVDAEANDAIRAVVARQGLSGVFDVADDDSGERVSHRFDRFCSAYDGLRKMLAGIGMRLDVRKPAGRKPLLSAVPRTVGRREASSDGCEYSMSDGAPPNHMLLLGSGEMERREVAHLYADAEGRVSGVQTLFGLDERQVRYELSSESGDELVSDGRRKLEEMQAVASCSLAVPEGEALDVGDAWAVVDDEAGWAVEADVEKVIVKVTDDRVSVSNEVGDARIRRGGTWLSSL